MISTKIIYLWSQFMNQHRDDSHIFSVVITEEKRYNTQYMPWEGELCLTHQRSHFLSFPPLGLPCLMQLWVEPAVHWYAHTPADCAHKDMAVCLQHEKPLPNTLRTSLLHTTHTHTHAHATHTNTHLIFRYTATQ